MGQLFFGTDPPRLFCMLENDQSGYRAVGYEIKASDVKKCLLDLLNKHESGIVCRIGCQCFDEEA